jgi:hypothetical protein
MPYFRTKPALAGRLGFDVDVSDTEAAITEFKTLVSEEYLDTILEKDNRVQNEVETILLAEQFI